MDYIIGIIVLVVICFYLWGSILEKKENIAKKRSEVIRLTEAKENLIREFEEKYEALKRKVKSDIDQIILEKEKGFPWLAEAMSEYYKNMDFIYADYLEHKKHPAKVQAEKIREIANEKKIYKKEFLVSKYIIKYYESLFPWLPEYVGINSDELINEVYKSKNKEEDDDPVKFYFLPGEYEKLSVSERNQKALDRYWKRRDKEPWRIGRDYERYVGYIHERAGWKVEYFGAEMRFEDLGRDLICIKGNETHIIQCKYWSKEKGIPIRENHVNQLLGTTIQYLLHNKIKSKDNMQIELFPDLLKEKKILPVIATSGQLSETAKDFAKILGVKVKEDFQMDINYPCIKCNISSVTGEKIYHLPFDQQYDNVVIESHKGECYVKTVDEAEKLGFRRAWKWKGNKS